jgi:hypothetical protein
MCKAVAKENRCCICFDLISARVSYKPCSWLVWENERRQSIGQEPMTWRDCERMEVGAETDHSCVQVVCDRRLCKDASKIVVVDRPGGI